jgi:hypothetical protein
MSLLYFPTNFGRMVIHLTKDLMLTLLGSWTQNSVATCPKVVHFPNHCTLRLQKLSNWQPVGRLFFVKLLLMGVAVKISTICVTVDSYNRLWSSYGLVQTHHRNHMKHETASKILMVCQLLNRKKWASPCSLKNAGKLMWEDRRGVDTAVMSSYQ